MPCAFATLTAFLHLPCVAVSVVQERHRAAMPLTDRPASDIMRLPSGTAICKAFLLSIHLHKTVFDPATMLNVNTNSMIGLQPALLPQVRPWR